LKRPAALKAGQPSFCDKLQSRFAGFDREGFSFYFDKDRTGIPMHAFNWRDYRLKRRAKWGPVLLLLFFIASGLTACSGHSAERAGQGAVVGGIVGAAGRTVTALVFGGNVGEAGARGMVYGATTGAVSGAVVGAQEDQAQKAQREKKIEKLKNDIGEDAFNGLSALANCKHDVALGYAKTAAASDNKDYALAGLWIEVLTEADRKQEGRARALFPDLIAKDTRISSEAQAEERMRSALQRLMDIRGEYHLPKACR